MANITFYPENHVYKDENGNVYISVTQLISKTGYTFDADRVAEKVIQNKRSRYYRWKKADVLAFWKETADAGNTVHSSIEDYIKHGSKPEDESLCTVVNRFADIEFDGKLLSETIVHDEELLLAGTIDIIEELDDKYVIWDIKTSRTIYEKKLETYSLQLELYRHMLKNLKDKPVEIGGIIWLKDFINQKAETELIIKETVNTRHTALMLMEDRRDEVSRNSS